MTFEDLPTDWSSQPLSDPDLAMDVVDLFLRDSDRARNSALLLLCDDERRALLPVVINDIDWRTTASNRSALFAMVAGFGVPGVVVAVSGPRSLPAEVTERWRRTALRELQKMGVELIGFYSADLGDVRDVRPAA